MAVRLGVDYALARKTTWWFSEGIGPGTAVLTRRALYVFPHRLLAGASATSRTKVVFTIGGRSPEDAIANLLTSPELTADALDQQLHAWATQTRGPIVEDLARVRRIRIFQGWFRRSVVLSEKESGYDARPKGVRPSKEELPAFVALLQGRPGLELK